MNRLKELMRNPRFVEIIKFGINGAVCFVIDYVTLLLLDTVLPESLHWLSIAIGFSVSVVANYIICVVWVFKGAKNQDIKAKAVFLGSSILGLLWTELLMWVLESLLHMDTWLAKPIVTLLVMVWNYFMKRLALYGTKKKKS